ncbi:DegT/DnrJ/EryC1/StrS family aminotransferase [Flavobacterium algicola]|uniref:DegT/DnrJ/EryC1/StrS family aminotransferase n=1 Tax=Flavobacterium algicola TaxID=556529 RepID=UPI001EFE1C9F|nr:DegT/DnrJ/EryC1/StrS family aminotransferase [Flavobacterium algicola]MCG9793918.1 DegT/DnrJ/EryC1/StrS family aminotransferase [Flavobacterium algicola]
MNKNRIHLSTVHQGGSESKYIQEALLSNSLSTGGKNVDDFENTVAAYLGEDVHIAALSSGTAAIHLGLKLLGVGFGDEVICQSLTFSASANPILYLGATPIFIDSEDITWNLCPIALQAAIIDRIAKGKKPKAIVAVHLYGRPYQIDLIHKIANHYEIPVLEDCAEAFGSYYKGQACGTFGTIGVLSFNGNKIITTSGGGALITKRADVKTKAIFYATQSKDRALFYQHSVIGYNYRMPNICAAVGQGQMEVLDEHIKLRRDNHVFYTELFSEFEFVTVHNVPNEDYSPNCWLSTILVDPDNKHNVRNEDLRVALEIENIESRLLWKPMHLQPLFENCGYYGGNVAETLFKNGLCLPSSSNLTEQDKIRIAAVVRRVCLK